MIRFVLVLSFLFAGFAHADTKLSLMGSALFNTPDTDDLAEGIDEEPMTGFGAGLRALMGINDQLFFRSGAGVIQKKYSYESDLGDTDFTFTYINIPLTLYWKASPQVGFFGGTALQAKLDDSCDESGSLPKCKIEDDKSMVLPAIIGFDFSFTDKVGLELSYEYGIMETVKDVKVSSAVASLLYHFE